MKKNVASKVIAGALASAMVLSMAACGNDAGNGEGSSSSSSTPSSNTPSSDTPSNSGSSDSGSSDATSAPVEATKAPIDMSPLSITVSMPGINVEEGKEEMPEYQQLIKDINAYTQMDCTFELPESGTYYEQLDLKYTSGNVADVLVVRNNVAFQKAAAEGLFWDITDYLDDYDNLATIPEVTRNAASSNGRMYGVPRSRTLVRAGFGFRQDWLDNLGLKAPTTWDEFADMLYQFTYNDPDGSGVNDTVGLYLDDWAGAWDIMAVWFGVPDVWGIDANGDLIHKSQTEEYKTALKAFRELYEQGVINNGSNGIEHFTEKGAGTARKDGLCTGQGGCGVQVLDEMRKVHAYFVTNGLYGATDDNLIFNLGNYIDTGSGPHAISNAGGMNDMIAISTKNIKTEDQLRRVLQFLNDLNDGECLNLIEYGWEGKTYDLDENGYVSLWLTGNEEQKAKLEAAGVASEKYRNGFNQILAYFTADENARPVTTAPASTAITKLEQELYEAGKAYVVTNEGASYTSKTYQDQGAALDAIVADAQKAYILGEIDDAGLEEALNRWLTAGGEQVTKEMNELYHAAGN